MMRVVPLLLVGMLYAGPALAEQVAVLAVDYRLVGEDAPAPEKARMVEEQVVAAIEDAGFEPLRGTAVQQAADQAGGPRGCVDRACLAEVGERLGAAGVLAVAVDESGALYELRIGATDREPLESRITGPFSAALAEVKRLTGDALAPLPTTAAPPVAEPPDAEPPDAEPPDAEPPDTEPPEPTAPVVDEPAEPTGDQPSPDPAEERRVRLLRGGALGLTIAGGAALIAGVVLLAVDDPCVDDHPDYGCKERLDTTVPGMPLAGLGGIAVGLGVAGLVFIGRDDEERSETDTTGTATTTESAFAAVPLPGGAAASYRISF